MRAGIIVHEWNRNEDDRCVWLSFAGRVFSLHGGYYLVVFFCFVGLLGGLVDHNEYELDVARFVEAVKEVFV